MESDKQVNFYFSGLKDSGLVNETEGKAALKFIILQNDQFHARNANLISELSQAKTENDELSDLNSKLNSQKAILMGYLKNVYSLLKPYRELTKLYQRQQSLTRRSRQMEYVFRALALSPLVVSLLFTSIWAMIISTLMIAGGIVCYYSQYSKQDKIAAIEVLILDLLREVDDVEKANVLLDQLVDGL